MNVLYGLAYLFETLIIYIYLDNKYVCKFEKSYVVAIPYLCSFVMQFVLNFVGVNYLNLLSFAACTFLLCYFCYYTNVLQALYSMALLSVLMLVTELCVFYISKYLFGIEIDEHNVNELVLFLQGVSSKLLFFLVAYIFSKVSIKEKKLSIKLSNTPLLFLLPVASILILLCIVRVTEKYEINTSLFMLFCVSALLLLYSNIIVFWIYEKTLRTIDENIQLQLGKQKSEIDKNYYSILEKQYDNSNILIHDIKRHLQSIKELANEKDYERINNYIDNLYGEYQIKHLKKYSDKKLINVIINRYVDTCEENNIDFYCDIRDIDFSFITDNDITAILDNLLENAVESAKLSKEKIIDLSIKPTNVNFISILLKNSCSTFPNIKNGELITTKQNKIIHGFGINSIKKIVKNYSGYIHYEFNENDMQFLTTLVLKSK